MDVDELNRLLVGSGIQALGTTEHSKASEAFVDIEIRDQQSGTPLWSGLVPYRYRKTGLDVQSESEFVEFLDSIRSHFEPQNARAWISGELQRWSERRADVTHEFFKKLASLEWVRGEDFPRNPNPQRRIQDIKDMGYVVATRRVGRAAERKLLPLPREASLKYEQIPLGLRQRILEVLGNQSAYEDSGGPRLNLLPDHKFPEIRWDSDTPTENSTEMSDEDIRRKFQLLDNQRNQQKREVCRQCFQTGKRGTLFGVKFFYSGNEFWPPSFPRRGAHAEQGCVGCGWYDIGAWRSALNSRLRDGF